MEPNGSPQQNLNSQYFHQQHHHSSPAFLDLPTNGRHSTNGASRVVYPHSLSSSAAVTVPLEPAKRKRGPPSKYEGEQAKRIAAVSSSGGQGFTPHILNVAAGEPLSWPASLDSPTNGRHSTNEASHVVYPHSVSSSAAVTVPLEQAKKRRGRPRKYETFEQGVEARKMAAVWSSDGQDFTPHILNVAAGEDVARKIWNFMELSKSEICILSASGTISGVSLCLPGGYKTYEGQYDIVSLSGSYVLTRFGSRNGGLSICLSSMDGEILGGAIGVALKAAGPVQVIVSTFQIGTTKTANARTRVKASDNGRQKTANGGTGGIAYGSGSKNTTNGRTGFEASGSMNGFSSPTGTALNSPTDTALSSPTDTALCSPTDTALSSPTDTALNSPMDTDFVMGEHEQDMGGSGFVTPPRQGIRFTPSRLSGWGDGGPDGRSIATYGLAGRLLRPPIPPNTV